MAHINSSWSFFDIDVTSLQVAKSWNLPGLNMHITKLVLQIHNFAANEKTISDISHPNRRKRFQCSERKTFPERKLPNRHVIPRIDSSLRNRFTIRRSGSTDLDLEITNLWPGCLLLHDLPIIIETHKAYQVMRSSFIHSLPLSLCS